jgi:hypothetical protein
VPPGELPALVFPSNEFAADPHAPHHLPQRSLTDNEIDFTGRRHPELPWGASPVPEPWAKRLSQLSLEAWLGWKPVAKTGPNAQCTFIFFQLICVNQIQLMFKPLEYCSNSNKFDKT